MNVLWSADDELSIFSGSTVNSHYRIASGDGKTSATFEKVPSSDFGAGTEQPNNIAWYPYDNEASIRLSGSYYVVDINLPSTQDYAQNSFGLGANAMVAMTEDVNDHDLCFKNVLSALKIQLTGTATITKIEITSNGGELLCGAATVTPNVSSTPTIELTGTGSTVTLNCGAGVALNESTPTSFIISLPPVTLSNGFTLKIYDSTDKYMEKSTSKSITLNRAKICTISSFEYAVKDIVSMIDLSAEGTANCYIVNEAGDYKFNCTVKGNSVESVGSVASAEVLWESFGTDVTPNVGDIINNVNYADGYVQFSTPATLNNGNAVVAVKDASDNILWSWHIWVCDGFDPVAKAQVYNNAAGTMMDRNLGATSATKGDVHALGLLYQWGRKDPFLSGDSNEEECTRAAASTLSWPSAVTSDDSYGTIEYAVAHPTTFINYNSSNEDWFYTGGSSTDDTRWNSSKGVYDPCPAGWRVPDSGVWTKAFGTSNWWETESNWDSTNRGMDFGRTDKTLGSGTIWYPAAGCIFINNLSLGFDQGFYWSCFAYTFASDVLFSACIFYFNYEGEVNPSDCCNLASGFSVRCLRE